MAQPGLLTQGLDSWRGGICFSGSGGYGGWGMCPAVGMFWDYRACWDFSFLVPFRVFVSALVGITVGVT